MKNHRAIGFLSVLILLCACSPEIHTPRKGRDLFVATSPDKHFEATVRELDIDGSVGVSQPYQVVIRSLIVERGNQAVVLTADKTDGLRIRWLQSGELEVCFHEASIYSFNNTFTVASQEPPQLANAEVILVKRKSLRDCESVDSKE